MTHQARSNGMASGRASVKLFAAFVSQSNRDTLSLFTFTMISAHLTFLVSSFNAFGAGGALDAARASSLPVEAVVCVGSSADGVSAVGFAGAAAELSEHTARGASATCVRSDAARAGAWIDLKQEETAALRVAIVLAATAVLLKGQFLTFFHRTKRCHQASDPEHPTWRSW